MKLSKLGRISLGATTIAVVASLGLARDAEACTRILWNDSPFGVISSRSMDWEPSTSKRVVLCLAQGRQGLTPNTNADASHILNQ